MDSLLRCCCCGPQPSNSRQIQQDRNELLSHFELEQSDQYSPYESTETVSLTNSLENPCYSSSPTITDLEFSLRHRVLYKCRRERYSIANEGPLSKLECVIVPSYGSCPPSTVAVKKAAGDFLRGVGDDSAIIQRLIGQDGHKELGRVQIICHFEQVKLETFMKMIEDKMKDVRLKYQSDSQRGRKYNT